MQSLLQCDHKVWFENNLLLRSSPNEPHCFIRLILHSVALTHPYPFTSWPSSPWNFYSVSIIPPVEIPHPFQILPAQTLNHFLLCLLHCFKSLLRSRNLITFCKFYRYRLSLEWQFVCKLSLYFLYISHCLAQYIAHRRCSIFTKLDWESVSIHYPILTPVTSTTEISKTWILNWARFSLKLDP